MATTDPSIIPEDEEQRLAAVRRYDILDTPPDGAFDRITALAARIFNVPVSIVSIVDEDRIWFKSHHGIDARQTTRDPGLCASAILQNGPWVVNDAVTDPRALANPLVAGEFGLRFYAGSPLITRDGYRLGTINIIDFEPRELGPDDLAVLDDLAALVVDELELRLAARRLVDTVDEARQRAMEINDDVIQNLSVASFALQNDDPRRASAAIHRALSSAQTIVREMLEAHPLAPGDLTRRSPSG